MSLNHHYGNEDQGKSNKASEVSQALRVIRDNTVSDEAAILSSGRCRIRTALSTVLPTGNP